MCGGRTVEDVLLLQQVSFRTNSLDDVIGYYKRLHEKKVKFDMVVSHGNAVGIYFRDPEDNRLEIYWGTGSRGAATVPGEGRPHRVAGRDMRKIRESVALHGKTGVMDPSALEIQDLPVPAKA